MEAHEYANLFPMAADEELRDMAEDIKQRGLVCPIITLDDKILDGRNRLRACALAGVTPRFQKYTGSDPLADVVSWNLKRRHLGTSQKATLAAMLKPLFEEQARQRQRELGKTHGDTLVANLPQGGGKGRSRDQAAAAVGVSGRLVSDAEHIKDNAPEVFEEVKAGKLTVNAAKEELRRREEKLKPVMTKQEAALMRPRVGMKYAKVAIGNLQQIQDNDEERAEAFATVKGWINEHEA